MSTDANAIRWIESGKQIGKHIYHTKEGQVYYLSIAIQKWSGFYVVYFFEILEKHMACFEDFEDNEVLQRFENLPDALAFLTTLSHIRVEELTPLKGQRIFSPELSL